MFLVSIVNIAFSSKEANKKVDELENEVFLQYKSKLEGLWGIYLHF